MDLSKITNKITANSPAATALASIIFPPVPLYEQESLFRPDGVSSPTSVKCHPTLSRQFRALQTIRSSTATVPRLELSSTKTDELTLPAALSSLQELPNTFPPRASRRLPGNTACHPCCCVRATVAAKAHPAAVRMWPRFPHGTARQVKSPRRVPCRNPAIRAPLQKIARPSQPLRHRMPQIPKRCSKRPLVGAAKFPGGLPMLSAGSPHRYSQDLRPWEVPGQCV
jgi:hypothetical protein